MPDDAAKAFTTQGRGHLLIIAMLSALQKCNGAGCWRDSDQGWVIDVSFKIHTFRDDQERNDCARAHGRVSALTRDSHFARSSSQHNLPHSKSRAPRSRQYFCIDLARAKQSVARGHPQLGFRQDWLQRAHWPRVPLARIVLFLPHWCELAFFKDEKPVTRQCRFHNRNPRFAKGCAFCVMSLEVYLSIIRPFFCR